MPGGLLPIPAALCWDRISLQDLHWEIVPVCLIHFVQQLLQLVPVSHLGFLATEINQPIFLNDCASDYFVKELPVVLLLIEINRFVGFY